MSYDATKDTILGDKLMLFVTQPAEGGNPEVTLPIAFGTSCGVEISADTIDIANKMSGNWKEFLTGQSAWTVSSESLISKVDGKMSFKTLMKLMADRTPVKVAVGYTKKDSSGEYEVDEEWVTGSAIITALSMAANNGEICSSSCSLQGTGELSGGA